MDQDAFGRHWSKISLEPLADFHDFTHTDYSASIPCSAETGVTLTAAGKKFGSCRTCYPRLAFSRLSSVKDHLLMSAKFLDKAPPPNIMKIDVLFDPPLPPSADVIIERP